MVEGPEDAFCCGGCALAAEIIRSAGVAEYYETREEYAPRPEPLGEGWSGVPVGTLPDGSCEARLMVDGLRCASCVWVVERVLERTPGVLSATVSYATGRTTLRWDPARTSLASLARRIGSLGYRPRILGEESRPDRDLVVKLGLAVFAAANVMLFYEAIYASWWFGIEEEFAALFRWGALILSTPVALWCASPFFAGAWSGLRNRVLHMDVPIALGVAVLYAHGAYATSTQQDGYLDSLTMLVALLLGGRLLESRGRRRAAEAAVALAATVPRSARRATPLGVESVPVSELRPGDLIDVGAGEELPGDGVVTEGAGHLRMALMTGEADPVPVGPGTPVMAGTVLLDGALSVRLEATGEETVLQKMAAELRAAADRAVRPGAPDRIAPVLTVVTLLAAVLTFAGWAFWSGLSSAVAPTVAVLVVACPCALALARPLTAAAGLGAAARRGLLLRSGDVLLDLARVDTVGLDKTGTVTAGALSVLEAEDEVLRIAAGLERYSTHPVARAIVSEAARRDLPLPMSSEVREEPGAGIRGYVDGRRWELSAGGAGEVLLEGDGAPPRRIRLADQMRDDAPATIRGLRREGLDVVMITGDHQEPARRVGAAAGIQEVISRSDPAGKAAWVRQRQAQGQRVLFAGDGLNDGPALSAADVGVAMSSGATSSVLVADGVMSSTATAPLLAGFRAARVTTRLVRRCQLWSIGYNVLAIAAAAAGLVNPLVAAVLMPLSSAVVLWYAARVEPLVRAAEA